LDCAKRRCAMIGTAISRISADTPVVVAGPSLPLPPLGHTSRCQAGLLQVQLRSLWTALELQLLMEDGVAIADREFLDECSPLNGRLDANMELMAGYPYSLSHTDALAQSLVDLMLPRAPKKGLITDLDDTLWAGLVGEVGVDGVSWDQEHHTQVH